MDLLGRRGATDVRPPDEPEGERRRRRSTHAFTQATAHGRRVSEGLPPGGRQVNSRRWRRPFTERSRHRRCGPRCSGPWIEHRTEADGRRGRADAPVSPVAPSSVRHRSPVRRLGGGHRRFSAPAPFVPIDPRGTEPAVHVPACSRPTSRPGAVPRRRGEPTGVRRSVVLPPRAPRRRASDEPVAPCRVGSAPRRTMGDGLGPGRGRDPADLGLFSPRRGWRGCRREPSPPPIWAERSFRRRRSASVRTPSGGRPRISPSSPWARWLSSPAPSASLGHEGGRPASRPCLLPSGDYATRAVLPAGLPARAEERDRRNQDAQAGVDSKQGDAARVDAGFVRQRGR